MKTIKLRTASVVAACCVAAVLVTAIGCVKLDVEPSVVPSVEPDVVPSVVPNEEPSVAPSVEPEVVAPAMRRSVGRVFDLKGITVDGNEFDWSAYKGKIVLIDFWASWCGPCIAEVPNMIKAYEQFKDRGFEIVSVGISERNDAHKQGMANHKMTWVSLSEDLTAQAAPEGTPKLGTYYGIQGIPTMFLVGRDGKVIVTDDNQIRGGALIGTLGKILAE